MAEEKKCMTVEETNKIRRSYQAKVTFAGIPSRLWHIENACVAYATIRMFPFLSAKKVQYEFNRLQGYKRGLDFEQMVKFFERLGVKKYLTWMEGAPDKRCRLQDLTELEERMMVVVRRKEGWHITFIREDGWIWDTEPTDMRLRAKYAFLLKEGKEQEVVRRIAAWERKHRKNLIRWRKEDESEIARRREQISIMKGRIARHEREIRECEENLEMNDQEMEGLIFTKGSKKK